MELLVERLDVSLTLLLSGLLAIGSRALGLALLVMLGQAHIGVELGNLVGVLARSGHLNGTSPVEVKVTESEGEVL